MPARHSIDDNLRLITTVWSGEATDSQLIDAFLTYQQAIKNQPTYRLYHEIVDFSNAGAINISSEGIKKLAQIAAGADVPESNTRLAIVAGTPIAYGLGRMYEIYRSLISIRNKEVRVFKNHAEAFEWIGSSMG